MQETRSDATTLVLGEHRVEPCPGNPAAKKRRLEACETACEELPPFLVDTRPLQDDTQDYACQDITFEL